jgi:hypothetical protein
LHVFEGRCPHRGALLADGRVEGANLICRVHGWDYRLDTGVSAYNPTERIYKFGGHVQDGEVLVDKADLVEYRSMRPERAVSSTYDRLFDDRTRTPSRSRSSPRSTPSRGAGCPARTARSRPSVPSAANWTGGSWSPSGCCRPPRCRSCSPPSKSAAR